MDKDTSTLISSFPESVLNFATQSTVIVTSSVCIDYIKYSPEMVVSTGASSCLLDFRQIVKNCSHQHWYFVCMQSTDSVVQSIYVPMDCTAMYQKCQSLRCLTWITLIHWNLQNSGQEISYSETFHLVLNWKFNIGNSSVKWIDFIDFFSLLGPQDIMETRAILSVIVNENDIRENNASQETTNLGLTGGTTWGEARSSVQVFSSVWRCWFKQRTNQPHGHCWFTRESHLKM